MTDETPQRPRAGTHLLHEAGQIARAFHETYERKAPEYGYETREASAVPWAEVPVRNRDLMTSVAGDLLDRRVILHEREMVPAEFLLRRASAFVNAVAVMAEDKGPALAWLADAAQLINPELPD
jgi:hypothetical protein